MSHFTYKAIVRLSGRFRSALLGSLLSGACSADCVAHPAAGYQYLVAVFFLIVFPLNVLLRSFAATITVLYSWKNAGMFSI